MLLDHHRPSSDLHLDGSSILSSPKEKHFVRVELDPLWQNFLDPCMAGQDKSSLCYISSHGGQGRIQDFWKGGSYVHV